uniref:Uncharacterized protein n=1 Tax=Glossina morsitans morsitans TaxID=37546 RepID=A0A1B0GB48_GLOMM
MTQSMLTKKLPDVVNPDISALQEVLSSLTGHDKNVQIHFDEVYTDQRSVYSRSENRLCGRGYILKQKLAKTEEYWKVLVFGVRSMLTAFNLVLSAYPITHTDGYGYLIEENVKYAEAIGLEHYEQAVKRVRGAVDDNRE